MFSPFQVILSYLTLFSFTINVIRYTKIQLSYKRNPNFDGSESLGYKIIASKLAMLT